MTKYNVEQAIIEFGEDVKEHGLDGACEMWERRVEGFNQQKGWTCFVGIPDFGSATHEYRRKPKTLSINGVDVPMPLCACIEDVYIDDTVELGFMDGVEAEKFRQAIIGMIK